MVAGDRAVRDARTTEKPIRDSRVQRGEIDQISSPLTGSIIHRPQGPEIRHNFGLAQVKATCAIRYLNRGGGRSPTEPVSGRPNSLLYRD